MRGRWAWRDDEHRARGVRLTVTRQVCPDRLGLFLAGRVPQSRKLCGKGMAWRNEEVLAPYLAAGRPIAAPSGAPRARPNRRSPSSGQSSGDSRAAGTWARGQGYEVSDRGQIPRAVRDAYRSAH
jgi:hypothetical protein